jgi:type VI protein secretion system component VasA
VARVGAVLGAAVVLYISVNAFTHPVTLNRQATHFLTWPTESTLRAAAVGIGSLCAAVTRWSSISA